MIDQAERIMAQVQETNGGCWPWLGATKEGYGYTYKDGRQQRAHRAVYELSCGPVPSDMDLDHLCRNRLCVNPVHMEVVTPVVNVMRGKSPPAQNARKTHCKHGHEFNDWNTMLVTRTGTARLKRRCRTCENERRGYKVTGRRRIS